MVYLIGAGPGDPELITVKGAALLKRADCIIYDNLANSRLLDDISDACELIYVGKKASEHSLPQNEINELLVQKAKSGKIVIRLKGGDPFVFGRGGEEAFYLATHNIPFEIVPGITAGIGVPAYAGIPVTHRASASTVAFITGHENPAKFASSIQWEHIANGIDTLVFYMAMSRLPDIISKLIEFHRTPSTPVAVIEWGTLPRQKMVQGTLHNIIQKVSAAGLQPPAICIVGDVTTYTSQLNWFTSKRLFGKRIVVTRPRNQAGRMIDTLAQYGAEVIALPTVRIIPPDTYEQLDAALNDIESYDWIIFTSVNGVDTFFSRLHAIGKDSRALHANAFCTIGPATTDHLRQWGIESNFVPATYRAEALVEYFTQKVAAANLRFLLPRANKARALLADALIDTGAHINNIVAYKTVTDERQRADCINLLTERPIDMVTFTSSSTVQSFVDLVGDTFIQQHAQHYSYASIGPITSQTMREYGLDVTLEAQTYTVDGIVEAILNYYTK